MSRQARVRMLAFALAAALPSAAVATNGNVMVGPVTPDGDLNVNGDMGNNDVTITQNADGTITITGNNGTTVNGGASHTTSTPVTGELDVDTRGGNDKVVIDGVTNVEDIDLEDELGTNELEVKNSKVSDKLKIENGNGSIRIGDSSWGRRDIRPGRGGVTPANLSGRGGAGSVGTPPTGGGGSKAPRSGGSKGTDASKAPRNAQQQGLPTNNPGQRGVVVPELPNPPSGYGGKAPKSPLPKSGY